MLPGKLCRPSTALIFLLPWQGKSGVIYRAHAGGKSNLVKALQFMRAAVAEPAATLCSPVGPLVSSRSVWMMFVQANPPNSKSLFFLKVCAVSMVFP